MKNPPIIPVDEASALDSLDGLLNDPSGLDARKLAQAFAIFSRASEELSQSYGALQIEAVKLSEKFDVLMAALPAAVLVLDRQGCIEHFNRAAEQWLGSDLTGKSWREYQEHTLEAGVAQGEWVLNPGEHERVLSLTETVLEHNGGHLLLLQDVTDAQKMRRQAERNERLAVMGEMVAGLAHQLRTPIAAALLYAGNLASPMLGVPERAKCVERIQERLRHLEKLIRDMLIFARGDSLGREAFSIGSLLAELAVMIEPLARQKGVGFVAQPAAESATIEIMGNRKEIVGALLNLLENALQATESGGLVSLLALEEGGMAFFSVQDTGKGIPLDVQARLFTPFFTTRAEGTGLGLAIARGVARAHGGDIALQSREGEGTRFTFTLPVLGGSQALEDKHE